MRLLHSFAALLLVLLPALPSAQVPQADTPRKLIDRLGVQTRLGLEQQHATPSAEDSERAVADAIRTWARRTPGDDALHAGDDLERTPLMQAVSGAYVEVVAALLEDPIVRARIHTRNRAGETAWMIAATAPAMTLPACQPGTLTVERQALLRPYVSRMNALHQDNNASLHRIVQMLQAAGAHPEPEAARTAWLSRCPDALAATRTRVATGILPAVLLEEATERVLAYNKTANAGATALPQRPPAATRFTPADPAAQALAVYASGQLHCASRPVPALAALAWSGRLTIHARAVTRAGIVEAVDLDVVSPDASPPVADHFRRLIIQTLAEYRCEGDGVFTHAFDFRVG